MVTTPYIAENAGGSGFVSKHTSVDRKLNYTYPPP